jgi:glutamate dehydrogenase/leucine dehydrogenase
MPVTHMADAALRDRGTAIVPDLLANAGGVIAPTSNGRKTSNSSPGTETRSCSAWSNACFAPMRR